jgi:DNA-binding NarL/FixJ family response regulator
VKVLLADDHRLTLAGVRRALNESADIVVVGEALSGADVLPLVRSTKPDLVLLDLRLPKVDGLTCLDMICRHYPAVKVVIVSASAEPTDIAAALNRGACAYIVKTVDPLDFPAVLRQAVEHTVYYSPPQPAPALRDGEGANLTDRERAMLGGVVRGLSNKAISRELWVTEQTVKFHLSNIYKKLGVPNRTAAARFAHEHDLIDMLKDGAGPAAS